MRVLNDDRIAAGAGFGTHPHRGMEIITIVLSGAIAHRDSMGNGSTIAAGSWQLMSAGSGVSHSEVNPSPTEPTHLLQTWLISAQPHATPRYAEARPAGELGAWEVVAAPDSEAAPLPLRQDARIAALRFGDGRGQRLRPRPGAGRLPVLRRRLGHGQRPRVGRRRRAGTRRRVGRESDRPRAGDGGAVRPGLARSRQGKALALRYRGISDSGAVSLAPRNSAQVAGEFGR